MQQLSAFDASFLYLESPAAPQHIMAVLVIEAGFDAERFVDVVGERIHLVPAFRRRLVTVPLHLDAPYWLVDPHFEVRDHTYRFDAPAPGDLAALGAVVGRIGGQLLDRSRPLWELHVVRGLADGRSAVVIKVHHSTMYGTAGVTSLASLLDLGPDGGPVEPDTTLDAPRLPPELMVRRAAAHLVARPRRVARLVRGVGAHAGDLGRTLGRAAVGRSRMGLPYRAPQTPWNGRLTPARRAGFASLPLADVLAIRKRSGATVNDIVLTAVAGSLRDYLLARDGVPDRPLLASVPVLAGTGSVDDTDLLSAMLVPLYVDEPDPGRRLARVAEAAAHSRGLTDALGPAVVSDALEVLPPPLLVGAARAYERWRLSSMHPPLQSLIVSNVVGSRVPLYAAGARVEAFFPLGPLIAGSGLNVTVVSHDGMIDIGALACPDLVDDVDAVADGVREAFEELQGAV